MLRGYPGKVAVVTGAANGLGLVLARELAARNCNLALIDIDAAALAEAAAQTQQAGIAVTTHRGDVSSAGFLERAAAGIAAAHGAVHLLVNNAAVSASAAFLNTDAAAFDRITQVNYMGVVHGCRAFLPFLQQHGEGQILNVASCFAWAGYPRKTAYAASKGAVRAFSESLRWEIAPAGVGITVLYPGPLYTAIARKASSDSAEASKREDAFLKDRGLPLDRVARKTLDRLLANPSRIVIGADYRFLDILTRVSPGLASRLMDFASRRNGF